MRHARICGGFISGACGKMRGVEGQPLLPISAGQVQTPS